MPSISDKGSSMPASPIRRLVPYAEAAKSKGIRVYHLNIGQPDIETPPAFWESIRDAGLQVLAYSNSDGALRYREKFCQYYNNLGIYLTPDQLVITTGASEALHFGMFTCLDDREEIIIPEPLYANYIGFANAGNFRIKPITTYIENGFALPDIHEFNKLITPRTKAILICNPNNPTGYMYSGEELETLRSIVLEHDLFLFSDEVYREFAYGGQKHQSVLSLEGLEEHAIVFDSISKRFSACGARIGALISRNREVISTALKFAQARLSPPTLGQIGGEALFELGPDYYRELAREYEARRDYLVAELQQIEGVSCPSPGGAFYVFAKLPIDDADRFCQWLLEEFSLEGETVMLAPGSGFYVTEGAGKQEVRIAYVLNIHDLQQAVKCLKEALRQYPGRNMPAKDQQANKSINV